MKPTVIRIVIAVSAVFVVTYFVWPKHTVPDFLAKSGFKLTRVNDSEKYLIPCDEVEQVKVLLQQQGYSNSMSIDADTPDGRTHNLNTYSSGLHNIEIDEVRVLGGQCTMKF